MGFGKNEHVDGDGEEKKDVRSWRMGREAYEKKMVHHEGIKQLWESKWKFPVGLHSKERNRKKRKELTSFTHSVRFQCIHFMMENSRILNLCFRT